MSSAYLLVWNPDLWPWKEFAAYAASLRKGQIAGTWSSGKRKHLPVGSRFYLARVGPEPRGLIGSGIITDEPHLGPHWDRDRARRGQMSWFVGTQFDVLESMPILPLDELNRPPFDDFIWTPRGSGIEIPRDLVSPLARLWARTLKYGHSNPDEFTSSGHPEGSVRRITVNAYERDPRNRVLCIAHHGARCFVCGMDFQESYGPSAAGFIHVHHLKPLSAGVRKPDPIRDMIPVCPNCHAVIHMSTPPLRPDRLRRMVSRHRGRRRLTKV